ncbi:MAG TPA: class I SAM-dependent methyltransferase [Steroidobacteraceae bacterium]|nr:class I SAM-dependent methyltransferase [Steroidobacteraceae bacterium]
MSSEDSPLEARLKREAQFHDKKYGGDDLYPRHYAARPTYYVYRQLRESLGDLQGKRVLEYGCGEGWITQDLAHLGGNVCAFDISPQAAEHTRRVLSDAQLLERCSVDVMPAEQLSYPAECFDVAVGFAIIHHLDLERAFEELYRVLKPGGTAWFAEPLATNPLIQIYRRLTPQFRTPDEQPLRLRQLPSLLARFRTVEHREFYLTALGAIAVTYLPGGVRLFPSLSRTLHHVDRFLLRALPPLGSWAWYTLLKIVK